MAGLPFWLNICVGARVHAKVCVHWEALGPTLIKMQFNQSADGVSRGNWYWTEMSNMPWIAERNRKLGRNGEAFLFILIKRYLFDLFACQKHLFKHITGLSFLLKIVFLFWPFAFPWLGINLWTLWTCCSDSLPSIFFWQKWISLCLSALCHLRFIKTEDGRTTEIISFLQGRMCQLTWKLKTTWMTLCDWPIQCFHSFHPLYGPLIRKMDKLVYRWFTSHT